MKFVYLIICLLIIIGIVLNFPKKKGFKIGIFGSVSKKIEPNSNLYNNIVYLAKNLPKNREYILPNAKSGVVGLILNELDEGMNDKVITYGSYFFKEQYINRNYKVIMKKTVIEYEQGMLGNSDIYIFLPGGIGSLFEFLTSLFLMIEKVNNKPIFIGNIDGFYDPVLKYIYDLEKKGYLRKAVHQKIKDKVKVFNNTKDLIKELENQGFN